MKSNKSLNNLISLIMLLLLVVLPISGFAQIPQAVSYQGYLTDSDGNTVDGTVEMTFRIYNVVSGGTASWTETHSSVTVNQGVYNVMLGSVDPTGNPLNLPFDTQYYLGIEVGTDGEMDPMQQLTAVPYAINADTVDDAHAADLEESAEIDADILAHSGDSSAHHARYTDSEAQTAMGTLDNTNPLNHERRTGTQVFNAVLSRDGAGSTLDADFLDGQHASAFMPMSTDNWVNESGDTMTGDLTVLGNVGIGTSSPGADLDVNGIMKLTGNSFSYLSNHPGAGREMLRLRAKDTSVNGSAINLFGNADSEFPGGIKFLTSDTTRMAINSDGDFIVNGNNIIISGPGDPTYNNVLLSLINTTPGTGRTWGLYSHGTTGTLGIGIAFLAPSMVITAFHDVGIGTESPSAKLHVVGDIYATGSITEGSSRELKERIQDLSLDEAITALNKLSPQKFYYKADKEDEHIGFIAEDVPELVATQDRKSLSPMDIVAVLTKVVKEQQKTISELSEKVDNLGRDSKLRGSLASADAY